MKILVTGAAGFIGGNLCSRLMKNNIQFIGVDNLSDTYGISLKKENVEKIRGSKCGEFIKADITKPATFRKLSGRGITHVIHLAARAGVRDSTRLPREYFTTNIVGTYNVLEFAKKSGAKKAVLASTSSVYGLNRPPFSESQQTNTPLSFYSSSKIGMESLAFSFHRTAHLPITILRFFTVYGPGGRPDMAIYRFALRIADGEEIEIFGDENIKRDFTFVEDTIDGILLALDYGAEFEIFNIGNSDARDLGEMISLLEKNLGAKAKRKFLPKFSEDVDFTLADISKAAKLLGYSPKVGLEEGLAIFCKWFRRHKGIK